MKKHNEGYTLPYVLVVFLVLSLAVVAVLTVAGNNLHSQKVSIQKMEEQYAAQGAVEAAVALLTNQTIMNGFQVESGMEAVPGKIDQICAALSPENGAVTIMRDAALSETLEFKKGEAFDYSFHLVSRSGSVAVLCELELTGTFGASEQEDKTILYTVTAPAVTFKSCRITNIAETEVESDD